MTFPVLVPTAINLEPAAKASEIGASSPTAATLALVLLLALALAIIPVPSMHEPMHANVELLQNFNPSEAHEAIMEPSADMTTDRMSVRWPCLSITDIFFGIRSTSRFRSWSLSEREIGIEYTSSELLTSETSK